MSRTALGLLAGLMMLGAARQTALADSFVLTEKAGGKLVCAREDGERYCEVTPAGTFKVVVTMNWEDLVEISDIDGDTTFSMSIGNLDIEAALDEDPNYTRGKKSAVLRYGHFDDNDKFIEDMRVVLRWTAKRFTAKVTGKVNVEQGPILADQYADEEYTFEDTQDASLSFAGLSIEDRPINITGKTTRRTASRGNGADREEFEIITVKLKGKPAPLL